jgi:hypothetical protein
MTAAGIVAALGGKRGRCACPVCRADGRDRGGDHLAVREDGGRLLVHCHAGCEQTQVIEALRGLGLWPQPERRELTREKRRRFAQAKAAAEADARRAWHWRIGASERLNAAKLAAVNPATGRLDTAALATAARAARVIEDGTPLAVLRAWREAWASDPATAATDERAGREHERLGVLLARAVAGLPAAGKGAAHGDLAA